MRYSCSVLMPDSRTYCIAACALLLVLVWVVQKYRLGRFKSSILAAHFSTDGRWSPEHQQDCKVVVFEDRCRLQLRVLDLGLSQIFLKKMNDRSLYRKQALLSDEYESFVARIQTVFYYKFYSAYLEEVKEAIKEVKPSELPSFVDTVVRNLLTLMLASDSLGSFQKFAQQCPDKAKLFKQKLLCDSARKMVWLVAPFVCNYKHIEDQYKLCRQPKQKEDLLKGIINQSVRLAKTPALKRVANRGHNLGQIDVCSGLQVSVHPDSFCRSGRIFAQPDKFMTLRWDKEVALRDWALMLKKQHCPAGKLPSHLLNIIVQRYFPAK